MINKTETEIMKSWQDDQDEVKVSVRCLAYNHEKYIGQCLDSFLMQRTNFSFEIVIHDDASTDQTAKIIQEYERCFPRIVKPICENENQYSKHDGSLSRILNTACKGKYIALCEGDDYWSDPDKLQIQYDYMESHPDCVCCGHLTESVTVEGKRINCFLDDVKPGTYTWKDAETGFFAHVSSYFMRNIYKTISEEQYSRYLQVSVSGDRKMPILLLQFGSLFVMDRYMSVYRFMSGPDSFTFRKRNPRIFDSYNGGNKIAIYAKECNLPINYRKKQNRELCQAFRYYILNRDRESFGKILKLRGNPHKDVAFCIIHSIFWGFPKGLVNRIKKRITA